MKKVLIIMLMMVLLISILFVGISCRSEAAEEVEETTEAAEEVEAFKVTLSEDPITINVWTISGVITTEWNIVEELYEAENPNVDIVVNSIDPPPAMREAAGPAVAAGKEDLDILWYWGGARPFEWAEEGLIHDLKPYYDYYDWESQLLPGFEPYTITSEGEMPWLCTNWVSFPFLYYNKTIFNEVGIDPESIETIEDLFIAGKKLKDAGYDPIAVAGHIGNYTGWMQSAIVNRIMGPDKYAELRSWELQGNKSAESAEIYRSQEMLDSFNIMVRMADELFPKNWETYDDTAANEAFINGKAAMHLGGSWWMGTFQDIDTGRLHIPSIEAGGYAPTFSFFANGVCVPAYVSNEKLDRISDIFNKVLSKEYAIKMFESGAIWSSSANVSNEDIADVMDPIYFETLDLIEKYGTDTIIHFLLSSDRMETYLAVTADILLNNITPEEGLEEIYNTALDKLSE